MILEQSEQRLRVANQACIDGLLVDFLQGQGTGIEFKLEANLNCVHEGHSLMARRLRCGRLVCAVGSCFFGRSAYLARASSLAPKTLWAFVGLQILMVVVVAVPGNSHTFDTGSSPLAWGVASLLVLYFLLAGRYWAWWIATAVQMLTLLMVLLATPVGDWSFSMLAAVPAAGLALLLDPSTRRYTHT